MQVVVKKKMEPIEFEKFKAGLIIEIAKCFSYKDLQKCMFNIAINLAKKVKDTGDEDEKRQ